MDPTSTFFAWSVLIATFFGPIAAVLVTRWVDDRRGKRDLQLRVFRQLMANRRARLSAEFVAALNVVEIDFYGEKDIVEAYRELLEYYSRNVERMSDQQHELHFAKMQEAVNNLLTAMSRKLGYRVTRLDLEKGGYSPNAWAWREERGDLIHVWTAPSRQGLGRECRGLDAVMCPACRRGPWPLAQMRSASGRQTSWRLRRAVESGGVLPLVGPRPIVILRPCPSLAAPERAQAIAMGGR
jgi:hypothetical protein